jgi:hypothetical protein
VPERVLFDLEEARQRAVRASKNAPSSFARRHAGLLKLAAVLGLLGVLSWLLVPSSTPTANITLTSPSAQITETQPTIAWTSQDKPGQLYDVWILPAKGEYLTAPALFKGEKLTSPVSFAALKPGKGITVTALTAGADYRVLIFLADAGGMAGVPVSFTVKPTAAP